MRMLKMLADVIQSLILIAGIAAMMATGLYIFLRVDMAILRFLE